LIRREDHPAVFFLDVPLPYQAMPGHPFRDREPLRAYSPEKDDPASLNH
jgi:hypothetical protein